MINVKQMLSSKRVFQLISYGLLLVGLVADIVFIAADYGDTTFTVGCFVCALVGSVIGLSDFFRSFDGIALWLASLLYLAAFAFHMSATLPSLSDLWNGVNFIGGNQYLAIAFAVIFGVIAIALVVFNFFRSEKKAPSEA